MKTSISIILIFLFVQVKGQIIDFSQQDNLLTVRHDTVFYKADQKLFKGIIKTMTKDEVEFSQYKSGLKFIDSSFYLSQKLKSVIRYKDKKASDRFLFDKNGNKFQEVIYFDSSGKSNQSIWWHPNGQIWRIEIYYNGQKNGKWYEWFQNGNLLFEGEFKQGEKIGIWTYYNGNTKEIIRQEKY
jgi:antitoxin component YwqK of YwqJK toxin-antitoxin module